MRPAKHTQLKIRVIAGALLSAGVAACARADSSTSTPAPPTFTPAPSAVAAAAPTFTTQPAPDPRIFIASEATDSIQVWQGEPPALVGVIAAGDFPHNLSASNDGRWVASANRHDGTLSILDAVSLQEIKRLRVGTSPHDLAWAPDDTQLYVTHEAEDSLAVIDTGTWAEADRIPVGLPQHDLSLSPDGREIWTTFVGYRGIVIIDRATLKVLARLTDFPHGSHDVTFVPEREEAWVTSSGFIGDASQIDPFVLIFNVRTRQLIDSRPLGLYPFHSVKRFRDGPFLPQTQTELWYSDRGLGGVVAVDVATRTVVAKIATGRAPFHLSFGPNGWLYVVNHDDATLSVIDPLRRVVLHTLNVAPDPHGIVVVAAPNE
jgi:YVTN family beta-propeller protein